MELFKVIEPGLFSTVQDLGRYGYQQQGVVAGGAMDMFAAQAGNTFVGNMRNAAVLEITMVGPVLQAQTNCIVCITGANLSPKVDDKPVDMWKSIFIYAGQTLSFGKRLNGMRSYICVSGGIKVPQILNSSSTYVRGGLGGIEGRAIKSGDIIQFNKKALNTRRLGLGLTEKYIPQYSLDDPIRVIMGPDLDAFTKKGRKTFLEATYTITSSADRMGYRLDGPAIEHTVGADIISDAVNIGTIQVPKDGKPIILLSDRQTTGGYTRIANVISIDIPLLVQRGPGQKVKFQKISVKKAQNLLKDEMSKCLQNDFYCNREI